MNYVSLTTKQNWMCKPSVCVWVWFSLWGREVFVFIMQKKEREEQKAEQIQTQNYFFLLLDSTIMQLHLIPCKFHFRGLSFSSVAWLRSERKNEVQVGTCGNREIPPPSSSPQKSWRDISKSVKKYGILFLLNNNDNNVFITITSLFCHNFMNL